MFIDIALTSLACLLALSSLLPLSRSEVWWVRSMDYPRLFLFGIAVLLILLACVFMRTDALLMLVVAVSLACALYHAHAIYPYTSLHKLEVAWATKARSEASREIDESVSILCANVLMTNRNTKDFLALVESSDPMLLVTLETNKWWEEQLASLEAKYPFVVKVPQENLYGMHLYSKVELIEPRVEYLVADDIPSIHCRIALPSGKRIRCHFLHPMPPAPGESDSTGERDAELVMVAKSVADESDPVVVVGDLNDVAWSATTRLFRKISGLLDPRVGRGLFNTFHAEYCVFRWPLDHLFHSKHFRVRSLRRLPYYGSDHFALFTELELAAAEQDSGLTASEEEKRLAEEKMQRQAVSEEHVPD